MAKKILVIDDEPDFIDAVRMRLEANGYEVIAAYEGKDGIDKARKESPSLILLDLVMPKLNGLAVLSKLKGDRVTANIPVVILTAKTEAEYALDAGTLGASDYLVKPASMQAIIDMVRKYLP